MHKVGEARLAPAYQLKSFSASDLKQTVQYQLELSDAPRREQSFMRLIAKAKVTSPAVSLKRDEVRFRYTTA